MRICIFAKPDAVHTRRVVAGLVERGFSVRVMFNGPGEVPGATYEPFKVPDLKVHKPMRRDLRRYRYLRAIFDRHDLVAAFFLHHWALDREAVGDGRLVVWPWGSDVCPPPVGTAPSAATLNRRRTMLRSATDICTCGEWFADQVADFAGVRRRRISICPLGVDTNRFRPGDGERGGMIVGFMKGFGGAYGSTDWVRAIPRVVTAHPATRFEMVGGGPLLDQCRQLAHRLGVDGAIDWLPPQPHDRMPDIISRWTVSVMPSLTESFGVAALECAACGVPVVASRVGGFCETVRDGQTGLLTDPNDPRGLADAVIGLLSDPARRRAMGDAGRRFVIERYEWRDCADRWADYLTSAARPAERDIAAGRTGARGVRVARTRQPQGVTP